jgi:hypothetical protein
MRSGCCATLACLCTLAAGCYEWVRVPPGELAKLDRVDPPPIPESARQSRADYWAQPGDAREPAPLPRHRVAPDVVQTEEGSTVDADLAKAVRIVTDHQRTDFRRPLTCVVTPEQIAIGTGHDPPIAFKTADVRATEVYVYRRGPSRALWLFGFVVGVFTAIFAVEWYFDRVEASMRRPNPSP